MVKIAVYAIAKNESKHIKRFYDACRPYVDELIIVDTGSTDNTMKLLDKYNITHHQINLPKFRFDDARNYALDLVPHDVDICISLDLDEIPSPDLFTKLREQWQPDTGRAWVMWDTGNIWANNNRVHARKGYKWKYPCHEIITPLGDDNQIVIESTVVHDPDNSKPRSSYLSLLLMGHNENPKDFRMLTYLIREFYFRKMWKSVLQYGVMIKDIDGWNVEKAQSYRAMGQAWLELGNEKKALEYYELNVKEAPEDLEAWFPLAYHYYTKGMWQECFDAANKINELSLESRNHYVADMSMPWRMNDLLALACWNLGKKGSAKKFARIALELNPDEQRLRDNYDFILNATVKEFKEQHGA